MSTQVTEAYRISPQQQFIWALQRAFQPSQTVSAGVVFEGILDDALLQRALMIVVGRHEILRTVFSQMGALQFPVQIICDEANVWLSEIDLSGTKRESHWPDDLARIYAEFRHAEWDFQNGPLVQAQIVHLSGDQKAILIRASRLCSDKAGLHNVIVELLRTYGETISSPTESLPQYADVSEYFNETLEAEGTAVGRQFWEHWRKELFPPLRFAEAAAATLVERHVRWRVDPDLFIKVGEVAAQTRATAADVLLACWQIVLSRYFQQDTFTIGLVCSGRCLEGLNSIPGTFERVLPLPCHVTSELTFKELVIDAAQRTQQLTKWQDYFAYTELDAILTSLPVAFDFAVPQGLPASEPAIRHITSDESLYPHELELLCAWSVESPVLRIAYSANILSERDAEALQDQFTALLADATGSPSEYVGRLNTLSAASENHLVYELNKTDVGYSAAPFAHLRVQAEARRNPLHVAVVGETTLTYRELDERSTRLADNLRSRGIVPEMAVAVCMGRCPELLIALLAVLKSGAYYVPLDPGYPTERLRYVLQDSHAALILVNTGSKARLTTIDLPLLDLEGEWEMEAPAKESAVEFHPLNLAYTIYTSGSTGLPKGVAVSHGALANYLSWCEQTYGLSSGSGVIVQSAIGFDLTVTTLLAPLCVGQKIILLPGDNSAEELARLLKRNAQYTLIKVTPAHLQVLNRALASTELSGAVQTVVVGGEALLGHHIESWRINAPQTRLINEYGPTEATVGCANHEVLPGQAVAGAVSIGKPISNVRLYVLDPGMLPVPINVSGELYIGGAGLARGYLGQAALTASGFVPHPFSKTPGERLYKTGDLARYDAERSLHFLGRADDQVKVRGYRIELAEIEQAFRQHPSVLDAAVVVRERGEQKQLYACVAASKGVVSSDELIGFLADRLPDYMVPTQIAVVDRLPLTLHGKVDKSALPDPSLQSDGTQPNYTAPRNTNEQILAGLWAKALNLGRVSIHDNFFELGGDSIISIQIVNRARRQGLVFTPRQLFRYRTIAELAQVVKADAAAAADSEELRHTDAELTPIQRWFFEQKFTYPHHWNQAMLLEAHEQLVPSVLENALSVLAARHDSLRLRFNGVEQEKASLASEAKGPFVVVMDLSGLPAEKHQERVEKFALDIQSGLDLARGPLMKVGLVRNEGEHDRLLWAIHHLAVDVVSWGILIADLTAIYRQLRHNSLNSLPPLTSSFQKWSLRLNEYAQSGKLKQQLDYWIAPLRRHRSRIPVDLVGGRNVMSSQDVAWCALDREETTGLMQQVPRAFHTMINDVLLTALLQSFYEWTGEKTLTLDLENHGREELFDAIDLSRTVGWFTCIFPVTLSLASTYDCVTNLRAVKEEIRSIPEGGLGYGLLRYITQDRKIRDTLEHFSPPEINFNYLGRSGQSIEDQPFFHRCHGVVGPAQNPLEHRSYLLEITGGINGQGELRMAFIYSRNVHHEQSIRKLAAGFIEALRDIVRNSRRPTPRSSVVDVETPPLNNMALNNVDLNNAALNRLIEELDRTEDAGEERV